MTALPARDAGNRIGLSGWAVFILIDRGLLPKVSVGKITGVPPEALEGLTLTEDEIVELIQRKKAQLAKRQMEQKSAERRKEQSNEHIKQPQYPVGEEAP